MKSHRLIPILSIIMSCISVTLYSSEVANVSGVNDNQRVIEAPTNEVYKALQENDVPRAKKELQNISRHENYGFLGAMLLDAYSRGALGALPLGGGVGRLAGHGVNYIRPIALPLRPQATLTHHAASLAVGGAGALAICGAAELVTMMIVPVPGVATAVLSSLGLVGGYGYTRIAQDTQAFKTYEEQAAQAQSHIQERKTKGALAGTVGVAMCTLGPSLYRTVCNLPSASSIHACCQYKHKGHNLWSKAFKMTDNNLMTFSTKFLEYTPARDLMNEPMKNGMYPIHAAVRRGNHDLVELLIRRNVIITETNSTVTIRSCYSLDQQDVEGNTALIYAIGEGNREIATTLLTPHEKTKLYADSNIPNISGLAPLHIAVEQGHVDLIQPLVAQGARIQCRIPSTGITPLHIAAQQGYADCAEHLLRLDESDIEADHKNENDSSLVNMQDKEGNTPLLHAVQHGHYSVVRALLDRPNKTGADPFLANKEGLTPLMAACRIGHKNMVTKLIQVTPFNERRQWINQQDIQNRNALHHVLEGKSSNMQSIASALYNVGVDIDDITVTLVKKLDSAREEVQKALHITELHTRDNK